MIYTIKIFRRFLLDSTFLPVVINTNYLNQFDIHLYLFQNFSCHRLLKHEFSNSEKERTTGKQKGKMYKSFNVFESRGIIIKERSKAFNICFIKGIIQRKVFLDSFFFDVLAQLP